MKIISLFVLSFLALMPSVCRAEDPAAKDDPAAAVAVPDEKNLYETTMKGFSYNGKFISPKCIWYLSIEKATDKKETTINLKSCNSNDGGIYETFSPLIQRKDGMIGHTVTYAEDGPKEGGYVFYKYLGENFHDRSVLLVQTSGGWSKHYSVVGEFVIKGDNLMYMGPLTDDNRTKGGIIDAEVKNGRDIYTSEYISPWDLAYLSVRNGFGSFRPSDTVFDSSPDSCIGTLYKKNNFVMGFYPMINCGKPIKQTACYYKAILPFAGQTVQKEHLPTLFKMLQETCHME